MRIAQSLERLQYKQISFIIFHQFPINVSSVFIKSSRSSMFTSPGLRVSGQPQCERDCVVGL